MLNDFFSHTIYPKSLLNFDDYPVVLDCGANEGEFSVWANANFNAKCFGFEPDPRLYKKLINKNNVTYYKVAIGHQEGEIMLNLGLEKCSSIRFSENNKKQKSSLVKVINLEKFCSDNTINKINLIKMDIEGAELDVLEGFSSEFLAKTVSLTVEFHDFLNKSDLPRIRSIIKKMEMNGFFVLKLTYFTFGNVLMINQSLCKLTPTEKIFMFLYKYKAGINRFLRKLKI